MCPAIPEMERYRQVTPGSRVPWERAACVLPGGDTQSSSNWRPYPIYQWTLAISPGMPGAWYTC